MAMQYLTAWRAPTRTAWDSIISRAALPLRSTIAQRVCEPTCSLIVDPSAIASTASHRAFHNLVAPPHRILEQSRDHISHLHSAATAGVKQETEASAEEPNSQSHALVLRYTRDRESSVFSQSWSDDDVVTLCRTVSVQNGLFEVVVRILNDLQRAQEGQEPELVWDAAANEIRDRGEAENEAPEAAWSQSKATSSDHDALMVSTGSGLTSPRLRRICLILQSIANTAFDVQNGTRNLKDSSNSPTLTIQATTLLCKMWSRTILTALQAAKGPEEVEEALRVCIGLVTPSTAKYILLHIGDHQLTRYAVLSTALLQQRFPDVSRATESLSLEDIILAGNFFLGIKDSPDDRFKFLQDVFLTKNGKLSFSLTMTQSLLELARARFPTIASDRLLAQTVVEAHSYLQHTHNEPTEADRMRARLVFAFLELSSRSRHFRLSSRLLSHPIFRPIRPIAGGASSLDQSNLTKMTARGNKLRQALYTASETSEGRDLILAGIDKWTSVLDKAQPASADTHWLRHFCECAIDSNETLSAAKLLRLLAENELYGSHVVVRLNSPEILLSIFKFLSETKHKGMIRIIMRRAGLLDSAGNPSESMDETFPPHTRSDLLVALANGGILDLVRPLYSRWTSRKIKKKREGDTQAPHVLKSTIDRFLKNSNIISKNDWQRRSSDHMHASLTQSTRLTYAIVRGVSFAGPKHADAQGHGIFVKEVLLNYVKERKSIQGLELMEIAVFSRIFSYLERLGIVRGTESWAKECIEAGLARTVSSYMDKGSLKASQALLEGQRALYRTMIGIDLEATCVYIKRLSPNRLSSLGSEFFFTLLYSCLRNERGALAANVLDIMEQNKLVDEVDFSFARDMTAWSGQYKSMRPVTAEQKHDLRVSQPTGRTAIVQSSLEIAQRVQTKMAKEGWRPEQSILNFLAQTAFKSILKVFSVDEQQIGLRDSLQQRRSENRKAAIMLLDLCASNFYATPSTISAALASLREVSQTDIRGGDSEEKRQNLIKDIDDVVFLVRWAPIRHQSPAQLDDAFPGEDDEDDRVQQGPAQSDALSHGTSKDHEQTQDPLESEESHAPKPNHLRIGDYRNLIETYVRLGDAPGAAQIFDWMREYVSDPRQRLLNSWRKAKPNHRSPSYDEFVRTQFHGLRKRFPIPIDAKKMVTGKAPVAHSKRWWTPPQNSI